MRFHSKALFFKCVLLYLSVGHYIAAEKAIDVYSDNDPNFSSAYEKKFLVNMVRVVKDKDVENFNYEVEILNSKSTVDKLMKDTLDRIKKVINEDNGIPEEYNPL